MITKSINLKFYAQFYFSKTKLAGNKNLLAYNGLVCPSCYTDEVGGPGKYQVPWQNQLSHLDYYVFYIINPLMLSEQINERYFTKFYANICYLDNVFFYYLF